MIYSKAPTNTIVEVHLFQVFFDSRLQTAALIAIRNSNFTNLTFKSTVYAVGSFLKLDSLKILTRSHSEIRNALN